MALPGVLIGTVPTGRKPLGRTKSYRWAADPASSFQGTDRWVFEFDSPRVYRNRAGLRIAASWVAALSAALLLFVCPAWGQRVPRELQLAVRSDAEAALAELDASLAADPNNIGLLRLRNQALVSVGQLETALRESDLLRGPEGPKESQLRGWLLRAELPVGIDQKIEAGQHALQIDPRSALARWTLGKWLLAAGRTEEAAAILDSGPPGDGPDAWLKAAVRIARGELIPAESLLRGLLERDREDETAQRLLAEILRRQKNLVLATRAAERALFMSPASPEAFLTAAAVEQDRGASDTALELAHQGLTLAPLDAALLELAVVGELDRRNWDAAKSLLDRWQTSPGAPQALAPAYFRLRCRSAADQRDRPGLEEALATWEAHGSSTKGGSFFRGVIAYMREDLTALDAILAAGDTDPDQRIELESYRNVLADALERRSSRGTFTAWVVGAVILCVVAVAILRLRRRPAVAKG